MPLRRMLPFILINIVVSATVLLLILFWWDSRQPQSEVVTATAPPVAFETQPTLATSGLLGEATPGIGADDDDETDEPDEPEDGPVVHIVQAGETLGNISQQYDVPVGDIATANDIVNVNSISIGQELIIPIGGLPTATPPPTATATQTPTATALATEPAETEDPEVLVEITEVLGVGAFTEEAVRITNTGAQPLALEGWQLEDEDGNVYTFIDATLFGTSDAGAPSILIHTEAGQNGPSDLYWGMETAVWERGEIVSLYDEEGVLQASYAILE